MVMVMGERPRVSIFFSLILFSSSLNVAKADLSDFGGDVRQYMSLLQGTSAFSFSPDKGEDRKPREDGTSGSGMGDFGGDYGDYLKLLESNSALGFNPQADPIGDNQDLQSDVFGGGMTAKFWDMYKGSTSYDSFDEEDSEVVQELEGEDDDNFDGALRMVTKEFQDPEDAPNAEQEQQDRAAEKDQTVVIAFKPSKAKMSQMYTDLNAALKDKDSKKVYDILEDINLKKLLKDEEARDVKVLKKSSAQVQRKVVVVGDRSDVQSNDDDQEAYAGETETESRIITAKTELEAFIKKMTESTPDPVMTSKGLSTSYKNLTLYGLSKAHICGPVKKSFKVFKATLCLPSLTSTVDSTTGPGVPFKGRVAGIFKAPKIHLSFSIESGVHIKSVKLETAKAKFVPTYDSSIPLNPWSKVSMSGYMVSRIKKTMPSLVEKLIMKISRVIEKIDKNDT